VERLRRRQERQQCIGVPMVRFDPSGAVSDPTLMLHLMRSGVPNDEILKAKTLDDYVEIANRHGIILGPTTTSGSSSSRSSSPAPSPVVPSPPMSDRPDAGYDIRRFTAPPSAFAAEGLSEDALERARVRRAQRAEERSSLPIGI